MWANTKSRRRTLKRRDSGRNSKMPLKKKKKRMRRTARPNEGCDISSTGNKFQAFALTEDQSSFAQTDIENCPSSSNVPTSSLSGSMIVLKKPLTYAKTGYESCESSGRNNPQMAKDAYTPKPELQRSSQSLWKEPVKFSNDVDGASSPLRPVFDRVSGVNEERGYCSEDGAKQKQPKRFVVQPKHFRVQAAKSGKESYSSSYSKFASAFTPHFTPSYGSGNEKGKRQVKPLSVEKRAGPEYRKRLKSSHQASSLSRMIADQLVHSPPDGKEETFFDTNSMSHSHHEPVHSGTSLAKLLKGEPSQHSTQYSLGRKGLAYNPG